VRIFSRGAAGREKRRESDHLAGRKVSPVEQHVQSTGGGIVRKLTQAAINFMKKEDGPTAVEYAIMLALIVTICIGVVTTIGSNGNVMSSNAPATVAIIGGN
jgi:pilus assembly protein Flp/PilA